MDTLLDQTAALLVHDAIMVNGVVEDTEGNPVPIETVGASWRSSEFERSVGEVRGHRFEVAVPPDMEISFSVHTEGAGVYGAFCAGAAVGGGVERVA